MKVEEFEKKDTDVKVEEFEKKDPVDEENDEIDSWMKLKLEQLRFECRARSIRVSGTKMELAKRLVQWKPSEVDERSPATHEQVDRLHELERMTRVKAGAKAFLGYAAALKRISEMQEMS